MDVIDFEQLRQHDFDLRVRDEVNVDAATLMKRYYAVMMGREEEDVDLGDFEKALVGLLNSNTAHVALLNELNFTAVEPLDAQEILAAAIVPTDEILDKLGTLRPDFDECCEAYAEQLKESELELSGPSGEQLPDESLDEAYRQRVARYVITSVLVDDRENEL